MSQRSIIVLEANEIPFKVFDYFCDRRPGSSLARLIPRSRKYRTHSEDRARFIMPWTTWPSFHRGVNDEMHQIFEFGHWEIESDAKYPPVWSILAHNGIRTGVFSSMQSAPLPANSKDYAFYVPDMFSTTAAAEPPELQLLQEFNLSMTRESARNVSRRIDVKRATQVVLHTNELGIRLGTYVDVAGQLLRELGNPARKVRRRAYQPLILFDAFFRQVQRTRPQFSTFFTNHVAAAMHRYWAAVFPEDYQEFNLDRTWVERYRGEIEFAMAKLDKIVAKLADFVDHNEDYALVIATSMGQAAIPASHVREFLTITDLGRFMGALGLRAQDYEIRPAMVPDFSFNVAPNRADELEHGLRNLVIDGKRADFRRDHCFFHVSLYDERQGLTQARLNGATLGLAALGIGYLIHEDEVACTAQHVPEGALIVYSPHSQRTRQAAPVDISALAFTPSVLDHFGIPAPAYMKRRADMIAFG